jgi:hypothetical protein
MNPETVQDLLGFFRVFSDVDRLKIAGLLARGDATVEEIGTRLGIAAPEVSRHLARLVDAGFALARDEAGTRTYRFDAAALEARARNVNRAAGRPQVAVDENLPALERKVLASFFEPAGNLKTIPMQYTKFRIVLHRLANEFQPGTVYSERQVNDILGRFHEDTATLRRGLVDEKLLSRSRSGSEYVRPSD